MSNAENPLVVVVREIEEVDACIADLNSDVRKSRQTNAERHLRHAIKALRRYRDRLVEDRDDLLISLGSA